MRDVVQIGIRAYSGMIFKRHIVTTILDQIYIQAHLSATNIGGDAIQQQYEKQGNDRFIISGRYARHFSRSYGCECGVPPAQQ